MEETSKKVRHTPGPWKKDEIEYSQYVFGPDNEMICEMRGWGYLTGNRRNLSDSEAMEIQVANCKLIAAAPSLLEALENLVKANPNDTTWNYPAAYAAAINAIKLAKGNGES